VLEQPDAGEELADPDGFAGRLARQRGGYLLATELGQ
jgi:hypothetical protein